VGKIPSLVSLGITVGLIAGGVLVSLWKTRGQAAPALPAPSDATPGQAD
jgi:tellurite resistance protein TerC